jgi:SAM-dependent methyltransferase
MVRKAHARSASGRALDAGCGDGKNAAFLLDRGWTVDAFDISELALQACKRRLAKFPADRYSLWRDDCRTITLGSNMYDMVVAYGLYHCINDRGLHEAHHRLTASLRPGGLFVYAAFNDALPMPMGHGTPGIVLRAKNHLPGLLSGWIPIELETGTIEEDHLPLIGRHHHSLTWAIFEKPL